MPNLLLFNSIGFVKSQKVFKAGGGEKVSRTCCACAAVPCVSFGQACLLDLAVGGFLSVMSQSRCGTGLLPMPSMLVAAELEQLVGSCGTTLPLAKRVPSS